MRETLEYYKRCMEYYKSRETSLNARIRRKDPIDPNAVCALYGTKKVQLHHIIPVRELVRIVCENNLRVSDIQTFCVYLSVELHKKAHYLLDDYKKSLALNDEEKCFFAKMFFDCGIGVNNIKDEKVRLLELEKLNETIKIAINKEEDIRHYLNILKKESIIEMFEEDGKVGEDFKDEIIDLQICRSEENNEDDKMIDFFSFLKRESVEELAME